MTTVSEISVSRTGRRRRSDAEQSRTRILDAAMSVLSERPHARVEEVAAVAGVTRQTVYAHFPSREGLLDAAVERVTAEALAAIDAAELDSGSAPDALSRLIDASWQTFERYPILLTAGAAADQDRGSAHAPVLDRLERLVRRGQRAGEFDASLSPGWLLSATVALGHSAGQAVTAGRMTAEEAVAALKDSLYRLYGAD